MRTLLAASLALLAACSGPRAPEPSLSTAEVAAFVRGDVEDAVGWAADVRDALLAADRPVDAEHVCQVLAVLEQESGYEPDPAVPGLARIVSDEIDAELARLGPLAGPARDVLLGDAFTERVADVRTEREVDLLFREVVAAHEARAPAVARVLRAVFPRLVERHNPIATAGSMQVGVAWAQEAAKGEGLDRDTVRDLLYTRAGGVRWGTARLFVHDAPYDDSIYRFADYNLGPYASRNAAFQEQLAAVTGLDLALDGDLLRYDERGRPRRQDGETMQALLAWRALHAPDLPEPRVRRDARLEKTSDFEATATWARVRETYAARTGDEPVYARVPDVALDSPKLSRDRTTSWFATSAMRRYEACLSREP